jgi:tripartite-type tricarboxylate transporter receptor subunit TctC
VRELIALAKADPGKLTYASAGIGSAPHIAGEMFKQMAGIDMVHSPYKGSNPALLDTMAGNTQVMFPSLISADQFIKGGKLRALAVAGKRRSPVFPDLPTVSESGVPGFEISQWYGYFAPAKTPRNIVNRLNAEINAVLKDPQIVRKFTDDGADIVTDTPEEFGHFVEADIAKWRKVVAAAHIKAE